MEGAILNNPTGMFSPLIDAQGNLNVHQMRPFFAPNGQPSIVVNGQMIRTNAAMLRYDEWKDIDRTVFQVATARLVGIGDLIAKGLVHRLGNIGQTIALWQRSSDMTPASVNMSGVSRGEKDTANFDTASVPVPVIFRDWELNMRRVAAARAMGEALDMTVGRLAARVVAEASEDMLFAGKAITVDGATIYGYTNHPDRNTVSLAMQWTNASKTGALILADVQAMLAAARADFMFGPFTLYIPNAYEGKLDDDFAPGTSDDRTIRERLMQLSGLREIKVADRQANHNVVLVQMAPEVVDIAIAQDITTVQWQTMGMLQEQFKTMAVWSPRIKSDFDGRSGVVHLS